MASPQRRDPEQLQPEPLENRPARQDRRDRAVGWWWIWVVLFIAGIVWFCGWGWFGYGGWWSHSRGTVPPTYQHGTTTPPARNST